MNGKTTETPVKKNKLWTRDFTIITLGSVVSMLGNAVSGFAISIMVLEYTESVLLYALFMIVYYVPNLIMPLLAGPYLDMFSRKKIIYTLDFISAGIYLSVFFILRLNLFNYPLFLILSFFIGSIDSFYQVAYASLYPNLVSEGNMSKAYSISSMIYPLAAIMVPIAAYVYENFTLAPLFLFNAATFLIAAIFETQIKAKETHIKENGADNAKRPMELVKESFSGYGKTLKEGISYIFAEKGLLVISAYFFVTMLCGAVTETLLLPYFKSVESLGVQNYTYVMGMAVFGRLVGGFLHYKIKLKPEIRFNIALAVYFGTTVIEMIYLFTDVKAMLLLQFINGLICVTSYNIRISSTQAYVPDSHRARYNGAFLMIVAAGSIIGRMIAGALGEFLPMRAVYFGIMLFNFLAIFFIMIAGRKKVKPIYNQDI